MPTKTRQPNDNEYALLEKLLARGAHVSVPGLSRAYRVQPMNGKRTCGVALSTVCNCIGYGWLHAGGVKECHRITAKGRRAYELKRPRKKPEAKKPARRFVLRYGAGPAVRGRKAGFEFTMPMTLKQALRDSKKPHAPKVICEVLQVEQG